MKLGRVYYRTMPYSLVRTELYIISPVAGAVQHTPKLCKHDQLSSVAHDVTEVFTRRISRRDRRALDRIQKVSAEGKEY